METRLFIQFFGADDIWYDSIINIEGGFKSLAQLLSYLEQKRSPDYRIGIGDRYRIVRRMVNPEDEVLISD